MGCMEPSNIGTKHVFGAFIFILCMTYVIYLSQGYYLKEDPQNANPPQPASGTKIRDLCMKLCFFLIFMSLNSANSQFSGASLLVLGRFANDAPDSLDLPPR